MARPPASIFLREAALSTPSIQVRPLGGPRLVQDYLRGEGEATSFYPFSPHDPDSFRRKWEALRGRFGRAERERAARALRPTSARAAERLHRFVAEGGAMVTTGQQAGLFTGPLYTLHKALTAVRLAEALEAELEIVVLPVFWTASEDHDWEEANHAHLLSAAAELRTVRLPTDDPRPLPMSERVLGEGVRTVLDELALTVAQQPFGDHYLKLCRDAYRPDNTVAGGFRELLAGLLGPYDVLLTDAADPHLKAASAGVLQGALERAEEQEELLAERSRALEAAGYHLQVPILADATNVFLHTDRGRERLFRARGGFRGNQTGALIPAEQALELLREEPGRFSPGVLLRPVVESAVFPSLAYVGGPGELSYFAQLGVLFDQFGMEPPVAYPRASVTLVEPSAERALAALGLRAAELGRPLHELRTAVARSAVPDEVRDALDRLGSGLAAGYRELIQRAAADDPPLAATLGRLRNESLARLGESERRVVRRIKARDTAAQQRLERVRAQLAPFGEPQERVLNVLPFLAKHGPSLLDRIRAAIEIEWRAPVG